MFDGVVVNSDELRQIRRLAQKGPLVLIPNHKSHIDYLILSYVMYHNNMPPPHIAAGKNLSFWPMGPLFRRGGAFFIRRQFRGAKLYSRVFIEYLYKLLQDGFNIEFFIEGTRSRTGKLILPKLGLLSMLLDAHVNGACEDLIFVPIYVGYDRVPEESAYLHELGGGQKEPENFWQVVRARRFLKKRYGKIYIQFHEAISLNQLYSNSGIDISHLKPKEKNLFCRELGFRVINAINYSTVVTAHGLVASALLNFSKKRFAYEHMQTQVETYMNYLNFFGVKLTDTLVIDSEHAIRHAFDAFVQRKFVETLRKDKDDPSEEIEYTINEARRAGLEYYKNNCVAFFIPAAYTAMVILQRDAFQFSASDLHAGYGYLQGLFKNEFAYDVDLTSEYFVRKSLKAFINDAIIMPHQTLPDTYNLTSAGFRRLHLYSRFLKTYFESYWIVLCYYMRQNKNASNPKDRLKRIESLGNRMYKRNEIERREALSKATYQNAVDYFTRHGIKSAEDYEKINEYVENIRPYMKLMQS
jgi:glycerol-3-phosphate O-acyltransferase